LAKQRKKSSKSPKLRVKTKAALPTLETVWSGLEAFKRSARAEMLSSLPLSSFGVERVPELALARLRQVADLLLLTLPDLAALEQHSTAAYSGVAKVVGRLVEGLEHEPSDDDYSPIATEAAPALGEFEFGLLPPRAPRSVAAAPTWSSVELEEKLQTSINKLQCSNKLGEIGGRRLGEFWDRKWGSAPFEEALTYSQLTTFKARILLEKKSFNASKAAGVIAAIEAALAVSAVLPNSTTFNHSATLQPAQLNAPALQVQGPRLSCSWPELPSNLPTSARMLLRYFESQIRLASSDSAFLRFLAKIPLQITAEEFVALWYLQENDDDIVTRLLRIEPAELGLRVESANAKIEKLFSAEAGELKSYWEIALRSPGIELERLREVLGSTGMDSDFLMAVLKVVLTAIGARHPITFGVDLSKYWSRNPNAFQLAFSGIVSSLPKSGAAVLEDFSAMFPFIDTAILTEVMKRQAHFNEREGKWVKRGE
jgi:hypothetical protein